MRQRQRALRRAVDERRHREREQQDERPLRAEAVRQPQRQRVEVERGHLGDGVPHESYRGERHRQQPQAVGRRQRRQCREQQPRQPPPRLALRQRSSADRLQQQRRRPGAEHEQQHRVLDAVQVRPQHGEQRQRRQRARDVLEHEQEGGEQQQREQVRPQRREARQHGEQHQRPQHRLPAAEPAAGVVAGAAEVDEEHGSEPEHQRAAQDHQRRVAAELVGAVGQQLEEPVIVHPAGGRGQHREERRRRQRVVLGDPAPARQVVPEVAVVREDRPGRDAHRGRARTGPRPTASPATSTTSCRGSPPQDSVVRRGALVM